MSRRRFSAIGRSVRRTLLFVRRNRRGVLNLPTKVFRYPRRKTFVGRFRAPLRSLHVERGVSRASARGCGRTPNFCLVTRVPVHHPAASLRVSYRRCVRALSTSRCHLSSCVSFSRPRFVPAVPGAFARCFWSARSAAAARVRSSLASGRRVAPLRPAGALRSRRLPGLSLPPRRRALCVVCPSRLTPRPSTVSLAAPWHVPSTKAASLHTLLDLRGCIPT